MKDITKAPIIGTLTTIELRLNDMIIPSKTFEIIEIVGDIYITNQWDKSGVPQIIHQKLIKEYTPIG